MRGHIAIALLLSTCYITSYGQQAMEQELTIRVFSPDTVYAGESIDVRLNLQQASLYWRGKMFVTEIIPKGFTAEVIDSAGGTFVNERERVVFMFQKFRGEEARLTVSYRLNIPDDAKGSYSIEGTLNKGNTLIVVAVGRPVMDGADEILPAITRLPKTYFYVKQPVKLRPPKGGVDE